MKPTLDDIVFEYRNREYGSYRLRKRYAGRLLLSFLISITSFALLVLGYFWCLNSGGDSTIFLMPSGYAGVKSVTGAPLDPKDLEAYLKGQSVPETPEPEAPVEKPADPLHSFTVTEEAKPDTFLPLPEEQEETGASAGMGETSDSTVLDRKSVA